MLETTESAELTDKHGDTEQRSTPGENPAACDQRRRSRRVLTRNEPAKIQGLDRRWLVFSRARSSSAARFAGQSHAAYLRASFVNFVSPCLSVASVVSASSAIERTGT